MRLFIPCAGLLLLVFVTGCLGTPIPTPMPTATAIPSTSPTFTPTLVPTNTPRPMPTPTSTPTVPACPSDGKPVFLTLVFRQFNGSALSSEPDVTLFRDDKEVSSLDPYKGFVPLSLRPGPYTVLVRYGNPPMSYMKAVCLSKDGGTVEVRLPYAGMFVSVLTEDGFLQFSQSSYTYSPHYTLSVIPADVETELAQPMQPTPEAGAADTFRLSMVEGAYTLSLTWADQAGKTQSWKDTAELRAGQVYTQTLNKLPNDGLLRVNVAPMVAQPSASTRISVANAAGLSPVSGQTVYAGSWNTWPLYTGQYTLTVAYQIPPTTTLQIPFMITSGAITTVQVSTVASPTITIVQGKKP